MIKTIEYPELEKGKINKHIIIDVRSPGEYNEATIPGAVNIPIFNDEDRCIIGTVYTQESVEKAKKLGMEAAAKKLPEIYEKISELEKQYGTVVLFCARGGMRSSSLVSLFMPLGINAYKLSGGYKKYRAYINQELPKVVATVKFIVIHGNTGVGKTNILKGLEDIGMDVIDLEKYANHRGSLLGSVGLGEQNSQKLFESLIYEKLKNRRTNTVYIEGESKRIGKVIIPEFLHGAMEKGDHIKLEADIEYRVKNIMEEYVGKNNEEIIDALNLLRKHISLVKIDEYIEKINNMHFEEVIRELMIKYYDPMYENKKYDFIGTIQNTDTQEACRQIINCSNLE